MGLPKSALQRDVWKLFETGCTPEDGSIESYLQRILTHCVDWFDATGGSIFLREGSTSRFKLAAQAGTDSNIPCDARITAGSGIAGLSVESGEPLLISDPLRHPLLQGKINTHQVSLRSSVVMPLIAPNEGCIGVLNLSRSSGESLFDDSDLKRIGALAQQISLAVSNARLYYSLSQARNAEIAARHKLEATVQALGVAVLVFNSRGHITDSNKRAQELLGATHKGWKEALTEISPQLCETLLECLLKARSTAEARAKATDNDRSWSIVCTPLPDGGAALVLEDTTAQDNAGREMARLARMAEIGQMTAAIAHEIRNPLTGIRSAAQMISSSPEHAQEFAGIIEDEVLKLNAICEEFLEFSRPLALRTSEIDAADLGTRLIQRIKKDFRTQGVDLKLETESEHPTINGDILRLEQVMRNLLLNALQACGRGGRVRLILRDDGFSIEDTGKGMQETDIQKLFTPFFTTKPSGTGLGLSNVRKIVDAHGGKIAVWSQPGVGSRFDVSLEKAA